MRIKMSILTFKHCLNLKLNFFFCFYKENISIGLQNYFGPSAWIIPMVSGPCLYPSTQSLLGAAQTKMYYDRGTPAKRLLRRECVGLGLEERKEQLHKLITHHPLPSSLHPVEVAVKDGSDHASFSRGMPSARPLLLLIPGKLTPPTPIALSP